MRNYRTHPVMGHLTPPQTDVRTVRVRQVVAHLEVAITEVQEAIAADPTNDGDYTEILGEAWVNLHAMHGVYERMLPARIEPETPLQRNSRWFKKS